jgi:hypothetical protein
MRISRAVFAACAAAVFQLLAPVSSVSAQDVFELEVFPYETLDRGDTGLELHSNIVPISSTLSPSNGGANHYPLHLSLEVAHGWTSYFETGVFLETAPLASGSADKFAGGHVRSQFRLPEFSHVPFNVGVAAEYAFNRLQFDPDRQTLEIRAILEWSDGRLHALLNPDFEVVVKGPSPDPSPHSTSLAGRIGWDLTGAVSTGAEYYSTGPVKHFDQESSHHFLLPTLDLHVQPAWDVSIGAGHCLTDANEPWIVKLIVSRLLRR